MIYIGQSIDIHKLKKQKKYVQKLGATALDIGYKIIAHSDGDIILHAISEAILGALSLNDIGTYFNDNEPKNKNLNSEIILNFVLNKILENKLKINNIDLTIICENIYFKNIKEKILLNLKKILHVSKISLKATRWEKKSKFIQCHCIVSLVEN